MAVFLFNAIAHIEVVGMHYTFLPCHFLKLCQGCITAFQPSARHLSDMDRHPQQAANNSTHTSADKRRRISNSTVQLNRSFSDYYTNRFIEKFKSFNRFSMAFANRSSSALSLIQQCSNVTHNLYESGCRSLSISTIKFDNAAQIISETTRNTNDMYCKAGIKIAQLYSSNR